MKFTFETDDEQEALLFMNGPKFYLALEEIKSMLRHQEKHVHHESSEVYEKIVVLREKVNEIIHEYAPSFYEVL